MKIVLQAEGVPQFMRRSLKCKFAWQQGVTSIFVISDSVSQHTEQRSDAFSVIVEDNQVDIRIEIKHLFDLGKGITRHVAMIVPIRLLAIYAMN